MRLMRFISAFLIAAQPVHSEVVQVPLRADGTVNLDEVLSGFSLAFPVYSDGSPSTEFSGKLLGEPFSGRIIAGDTTQEFTLAIDARSLSEHGNFLIAVSATGVICLRDGLPPGMVLWQDTKHQRGTIWEVSASCVVGGE